MRRPRWSAGAPITAVTLLLGAGLLTAACERGGPPLGRETTTPAPVVATPIAGAAKDLFPLLYSRLADRLLPAQRAAL